MKRPFYVHTPRNMFGEWLEVCPFTIRSVFEPRLERMTILKGSTWMEAETFCKQLNDTHEAEMMACHI